MGYFFQIEIMRCLVLFGLGFVALCSATQVSQCSNGKFVIIYLLLLYYKTIIVVDYYPKDLSPKRNLWLVMTNNGAYFAVGKLIPPWQWWIGRITQNFQKSNLLNFSSFTITFLNLCVKLLSLRIENMSKYFPKRKISKTALTTRNVVFLDCSPWFA